MIERLILTGLLLVIGCSTYSLLTRRQLCRLARFTTKTDPVLGRLRPGVPAVVYFTTPGCVPCRVQQQPTLAALHQELGDEQLQIIKIDAAREPDLANRWGVMTAPTTFIVDSKGKTRTVNHGVADIRKLKHQLSAVWA